MARNIYLVGSVPMANAQDVFAQVSAALGPRIKRLPDGETGERGDWITWLEPVFADNPAFVKSGEFFRVHASGDRPRALSRSSRDCAPRMCISTICSMPTSPSSPMPCSSALKDAGKIPAGTKFQVDLVPAHSVIWLFLVDALHAPIDPLYNDALKREIDKIAAAIPHDELAIQFDVASAVFARLERNEASSYGRSKAEMQETFATILVDLGNRVPADIDLLYHLCYGDSNHRHVVEPTDMGDMVEFANRVSRQIARPIQLIHMPVPRNRADDAYFAPLQRLKLRPETELCLGLVHYTDGVEGTEQAARHGEEIRRPVFHRHRMRLRPARSGNHPGIAAHPRRGRGFGLSNGLFRGHYFSGRLAALPLHLAAETDRLRIVVERHVGRGQEFAGGDVALELDVMRKPDRQGAELQAALRRNELGINGIAAFAVEHLAGFQRPLGDRHRVAAEATAASGRLAAQRHIERRDRQLQPDQMERLVHRRIMAARIGRQAVLLEAGRGIIALPALSTT